MRRLAVALVAAALATVAAAEAPAPGFDRHRLRSKILGQDRELVVRTPPQYFEHDAPYPVLYLTDGPAQIRLVADTVEFLARNGRMPELIVVGIAQQDRTRELTPTRGALPGGRVLETSGGADAFLGFVEKEVIPFVEARYRTAPYRILAGHSFGGLFALHALAERPELFQARIALSPTLTWDGELPLRRVKALLARRPDLATTLVYAIGDEGAADGDAFARFDALVRAAPRVRARGIHLPGEDHGTVVFDGFYRALREIFDGWRMPVEPGAIGPKGGLAAVEAHYRALSDRLGLLVAPPEATLNLAGYQLLQDGRVDDALAAFRRSVELYPASPNARDSLGEGLERKGELEAARAAYAEAVSLAERRADPLLGAFRANRDRVVERLARDRKGPR